MDKIKETISSIFDFFQGIVVFMAMLVMVYLFLFSPQEINGQSMFPTFYDKELLITNKIVYKLDKPKRGDIVIFKSPRNKEIDYIKRVIGLPGDEVTLKNSTFYINGTKIEEPYIGPTIVTSPGAFLKEGEPIIVPEDTYFCVGDNRPHSSDSREFGPVPLTDFIGKALFRYWPINKFWVIPSVSYGI
ncbi:MAG: Signal peptidase (Type I) [Microgenomates group bacterium GW2011_GWB1_40_9]|nr:MAG: Signal peptidase (Type I) [Microgenomates group bacterium GW2011_GWC1_39_12]KKR79057.1 MAG: Signal peptidase (Type I) [Microgenomates group bacterium GW2011_GWB1_40_9]